MMSCLLVPSGPHAAMARQHGGNFIAFKPRIQESSPGPPRSASPDSIASSEGSLQECSFMDPFQWWENRNRKTDPRDTNLKGSMNDGMNGSHIPDGFKDMDIVGQPRDDEMDMVLEHGQAGAFEGQKLQEKSQEILLRHGHKPGVKADVIEVQKIKGWEMLCMEDMISYLEALGVDEHPSMEIFIYILQKCKKHKNIRYAKRIHSHVCSVGLEAHRELGNYLIPMFVECGIVSYAEQISCRLVYRNEICWTSLIQGFIESGEPLKTFDLFQKMQQDGVHPSKHTFVALLKASARLKAVRRGQELHDKIAKEGFEGNPFIGNALVDMYAKCGSFAEARDVFDKQLIRDVVSWTALITGYAQHGLGTESLSCVKQMQKEGVFPDSVAFVCGLKACGNMQDIDQGREIHAEIAKEGFERDALVGSTLVDMYSKCGSVREAQEVFDKLPHHGVVLWNVLIAGYAEHGLFEESINCLKQMRLEGVSSDAVTFLGILKACGSLKAIGKGQELHMEIVKQGFERDLSVCNSLVGMYAKVGLLKEAWEVFDDMLDRDVVSWTALIAGYAEHGLGEEALKCFKQMQLEGVSPNVVTFVCSLKACGSIEAIRRGQEIHVEIAKEGFERDSCVGNTLVDMYAKCGSLVEAWEVFNELLVQDVVSWSAMILGYADQGESEMAFTLYARMQEQGLLPNSVTFVNILTACGKTAALETGKRIHAQIYSIGGAQAVEVIISTALIHMYCKCGSMDDAQQMFDAMSKRELAKWNALITGYSRQGETQLVLQLFEEMRAQRVLPNGVTFLSVLTACSHAGLVDRGHKYFEAMTKEYGITLTIRHHNCMIDLFSRAGQFQEATTRLKKMPFEPNYVTWNTLLGACKKWGNKELGRQAFECAVKLDEKHDAAYLLMFQIYEDARMWEDAKKIEAMRMKARRAQKQQGKSWIEIEGCVHTFVVGDMGHPQREDMYAKLKQLFVKMEERHRLGFDRVLQDIFSNAKEDVSCGHSEILAIACGIINTPERTTIRVAKNLRVCDYCHSMAALISKAEQRTIICSDASLSHVFRNGNCSCGGDYW